MESDKTQKKRPEHPRAKAIAVSALTFSWLFGTFVKGFKRDLEVEDLYETLRTHKSDRLGDKFENAWEKELKNAKQKCRQPKFLNVILRIFFWRNMVYGGLMTISELIIKMIQPFIIGLLVRYYNPFNDQLTDPGPNDATYLGRFGEIFSEPTTKISTNEALCYSLCLIFSVLFNTLMSHPYLMAIMHHGMQIRVGSCSLIYRKILRLSKSALGQTTVGQIVNLLSNDVNRFDFAMSLVHYLWIGPLQLIVCTYFMYLVIEWAVFPGVLFVILMTPLQIYCGRRGSTLRFRTALRTDERVRLMNEIISGIQVIKMYTWEKPFTKLVANARKKELKEISSSCNIRSFLLSFIMFSTKVSVFLSIVTHVLRGKNLTEETLFVIVSFYNVLFEISAIFFPYGILQISEALISMKRIENFMMQNENPRPMLVQNDLIGTGEKIKKTTPIGIKFENATAHWQSDQHDPTLNKLNIQITPGRLLAIIGPVGSGKSSILQAILKELPLTEGNLAVNGNIAYASQEPWLFTGSIRQNILFGSEYDKRRYQQVVTVCALKRDFELFEFGDKTIVGERGVSLSGGQRARINLARAVYKEADIYLLDDPLSAVDAHVGKHLFEDCIHGYLRSKTVVLVTHQLQYLKDAEHIVILQNGKVADEGTFEELQNSSLNFAQLLPEEEVKKEGELDEVQSRRNSASSSITSLVSEDQQEQQAVAEQRTVGSVGFSVYTSYFKSIRNNFLVVLVWLMFILTQVSASVCDYWGSRWSEEELINHLNNSNLTNDQIEAATNTNIYIYSGINVSVVLITLSRSWLFFVTCMMASRQLHNTMFERITRAPMRFFYINPSGRILNRFSKDMGAIDEMMPQAMMDTVQIFLSLLGIVIIVATVNPILLIPTACISFIFYLLRIFYLRTSRSIKRLEGITRSPVFQHLSATLQGMTTIRAFNAQNILRQEFDYHQDLHSTSWFIFIASSRAFGLWLDSFCCIYIAIVCFVCLYLGDTTGAEAGLAITQSLALTGMFQWGMRQSAELENQMTSVERVLEYTNIDQEPPLESEKDKKPPATWPSEGIVQFEHTKLKYDPNGQNVLHDVSFSIRGKEKVGIVGRTGAGKSTLISALFRLSYIEGNIIIDSIETSTIGLHDLRSKISIIPQEPVLFSGTMRKNLDPFDEYPDWLLWQALEEVELKVVVEDMPQALNSNMAEGGSNFSVGQRQLVCLARAIIRNNKILIMDEATANVDPETDLLIQKTIRRKFNDCTVLTIAHRLNTVMDSDRILVMDAGNMVEFDHPYVLLKNQNSFLYSLVQQTGPSTAQKLQFIAKQNYKIKLKQKEARDLFEETLSISSGGSSSPTGSRKDARSSPTSSKKGDSSSVKDGDKRSGSSSPTGSKKGD